MNLSRISQRSAMALAAMVIGLVVGWGMEIPIWGQAPIVTVEGDVKRPGEYPWENGLTVGVAVDRAGIKGESVRQLSIVRLRPGEEPPKSSHPEAFAKAFAIYVATTETTLLPGDKLAVTAYKTDFVAPKAQMIVERLSVGDFDTASVAYAGPHAVAVFEKVLRTRWQAVRKEVGEFQRQLGVRTEVVGDNYVGVVRCQFSAGLVDVTVTFSRIGRINDLSLTSETSQRLYESQPR